MARSISTIFDEIISEKETFSSLDDLLPDADKPPDFQPDSAQTFLQDLTSSSKVAVWRSMFWVHAVAIFIHEKLFDVFKAEVEVRAKEIIPATIRFYVIESLKFQFGDDLVFIDGKFVYEDSTSADAILKQIIKQASAQDFNRIVTIKLARDDGSGGLTKLIPTEKTAFLSYLDEFKIAGTTIIVITDDPDKLKLAYTIEFDPQVMRSNGTLIEDDSKPVQDAIDSYIRGLPFNSIFRVLELTDKIQVARGVVNAVADVVDARFGSLPFTSILDVPTEIYLPNAGYLATVDEEGTIGDIKVLAITENITDYNPTKSTSYLAGDFVLFQGIAFKANTTSATPPGIFDTSIWDTVSNLTFISI